MGTVPRIEADTAAELARETNKKFEASLELNGEDFQSLVMWSDVLINQVTLDKNNDNSKLLLKKALAMSLKAESFSSGIGAVSIARASAIQGHEKVVQKWLKHAKLTGNLPKYEILIEDPAFESFKNREWFSDLLDNDLMEL